MIYTHKADLLNCREGFIVHGCNAQGVMGSGVARGVKGRYPQAYQVYKNSFDASLRRPELGDITVLILNPRLFIVNAITQDSFGAGLQVSYDAIELAFCKVLDFADMIDPLCEIPVCFPLIGAGRGGGDWKIIAQRIESIHWRNRSLNLYVVDDEPTYCS
jgi:O-acetyl-ADP-ribose deacetylase (regulator of RNase III)